MPSRRVGNSEGDMGENNLQILAKHAQRADRPNGGRVESHTRRHRVLWCMMHFPPSPPVGREKIGQTGDRTRASPSPSDAYTLIPCHFNFGIDFENIGSVLYKRCTIQHILGSRRRSGGHELGSDGATVD